MANETTFKFSLGEAIASQRLDLNCLASTLAFLIGIETNNDTVQSLKAKFIAIINDEKKQQQQYWKSFNLQTWIICLNNVYLAL